MKQIQAVITSRRFDALKETIRRLGIVGVTVTDAYGLGRDPQGETAAIGGRGAPCVPATRYVRLELVVAEPLVDTVIETITGDGKAGVLIDEYLLVLSVERLVRARRVASDPSRPRLVSFRSAQQTSTGSRV